MKRVVVLSVASAIFLSNAGEKEVVEMLNLSCSRGLKRLGDNKIKAWRLLRDAEPKKIHKAYKEARNIIIHGGIRERGTLMSISFFIGPQQSLLRILSKHIESISSIEKNILSEIQEFYNYICLKNSVRPAEIKLSKEELEASRLIPVRTEKMKRFFNSFGFREFLRDKKDLSQYNLGPAELEVRNFIDGKRNILEIRNAVSAEYHPIEIKDVINHLKVLESAGFIKIERKK